MLFIDFEGDNFATLRKGSRQPDGGITEESSKVLHAIKHETKCDRPSQSANFQDAFDTDRLRQEH